MGHAQRELGGQAPNQASNSDRAGAGDHERTSPAEGTKPVSVESRPSSPKQPSRSAALPRGYSQSVFRRRRQNVRRSAPSSSARLVSPCSSTSLAWRTIGTSKTVKNGSALAGYGAITMKNALANSMATLPEQLVRSLTWDRGKEMSAHAQFKVETGIPVFFADPQSPWLTGQSGPRIVRDRAWGFAQLSALGRRRARISSSCRRTLAATASSPCRRWSISTTMPDKVCASRRRCVAPPRRRAVRDGGKGWLWRLRHARRRRRR